MIDGFFNDGSHDLWPYSKLKCSFFLSFFFLFFFLIEPTSMGGSRNLAFWTHAYASWFMAGVGLWLCKRRSSIREQCGTHPSSQEQLQDNIKLVINFLDFLFHLKWNPYITSIRNFNIVIYIETQLKLNWEF